jgi:hypothetical protein
VTAVSLNVDTLDILTALVILGGASVVVVAAILLGQYLERRQARSSSRTTSLGDTAVGPVASGLAPATLSADSGSSAGGASATCDRSILVMDDGERTAPVLPWRPTPARDLGAVANHNHPTSHEWIEPESDGLVSLYRVGFLLDELADELDIEPCSIVEELARRVFGATEPVADPLARRFGQPWTGAELRTLHSSVRAGLAVPEIARQLGRDQLSVVFRMLEATAESRGHLVDHGAPSAHQDARRD